MGNGIFKSNDIKIVYGHAENLKDLITNKLVKQTVKVGDDKVAADLVISCIGLPPNKESINALVPVDHVASNNRVKVNEFLQLAGFPHIYAIGDCCNTDEYKMASYVMK